LLGGGVFKCQTVKGEKRERKKGKNSRLEKNLTTLLSLSSH
jgi:hypothetical protein